MTAAATQAAPVSDRTISEIAWGSDRFPRGWSWDGHTLRCIDPNHRIASILTIENRGMLLREPGRVPDRADLEAAFADLERAHALIALVPQLLNVAKLVVIAGDMGPGQFRHVVRAARQVIAEYARQGGAA